MTIYFGFELGGLVYPKPQKEVGVFYLGAQGLLQFLELHLGLSGHPNDNEYLRIEQYRQALIQHLALKPTAFYHASFEADQLATAATLLSQRDELLLSSWDFDINNETPTRLVSIAEIEQLLNTPAAIKQEQGLHLDHGFAERFVEVLKQIDLRTHPIGTIYLNEPYEILPDYFQRLFDKLKSQGVIFYQLATDAPSSDSDLDLFKKMLLVEETGKREKIKLKNDGSLIIIKAKRETEAAVYLAKLFQQNEQFRPTCLIPEKNRALDNAFIQEGLPSLGILSASLARPSLQILKLVTVFLWEPIDPFKIMEFVSLSVKPLENELATIIANQMAQTPGLNSDGWFIAINRYFDDLKEQAKENANLNVQAIQNQYNFWFRRKRYHVSRAVPKADVIEIFNYLAKWAYKIFEDSNSKNKSLLVLSEQAKKVSELLEALPASQTSLSHLELERIVRTIYEPSPIVFQEKQVGFLPYVHDSSAIIGNIDDLLWWNFTRNEQDHFFSRWYKPELHYLDSLNIHLQSPVDKNLLLLWQRPRPALYTQGRLVLIIPQMVDGKEVHPHALHDEMQAAFDNLEAISFTIDTEKGREIIAKHFEQLPVRKKLALHQLGKPQPFIDINHPDKIDQNEHETITSLDSLFYYPYQWVFKHKIKLRKSSILSVVKDNTLMGNLAHRFFEILFKQDIITWTKKDVESWIDDMATQLLSKEGAVLLMYGREPEKVAFINRVKYAAWSLVSIIQSNGWKVKETEMDLEGKFMGIPIKGKADLVLERGNELAVVDFKWRGANRRLQMIKNEEDLQLVLYARLLTADESWAHTAYFIMETGKMIARNNLAFKEATAVSPDLDHIQVNQNVLSKMQKTFSWRMEQLKKGKIEIRTDFTKHQLEEAYMGELLDILEMKDTSAYFDDYKTLINLIE